MPKLKLKLKKNQKLKSIYKNKTKINILNDNNSLFKTQKQINKSKTNYKTNPKPKTKPTSYSRSKSYYVIKKKNANSQGRIEKKIVTFKARRTCAILSKDHLYLLYIYFGIINNVISGNAKNNIKYNLFFGKNKQQSKMLDNTKSFELVDKTRCFFYTSDLDSDLDFELEEFIDCDFYKEFHKTDNIVSYSINDTSNDISNHYMYICFNIGISKFYDTTKPLYYYIKKDKIKVDNKIITKPRFNELITFLYNIKIYLETNKYKKIVICGHSRGMTIATFSAYILLILTVDEDVIDTLPEHHNVKEFLRELQQFITDNQKQEQYLKDKLSKEKLSKDKLSKENSLQNKDNKDNTALFKELKELEHINLMSKDIFNLKSIRNQIQNNISICGTGGYPILWSKVEEFNIFNDFYKDNYIHIVSGSKDNNIQIYDNITYYNKFIYIYQNIIEKYKNSNHMQTETHMTAEHNTSNNTHNHPYHKNMDYNNLKQIKNINYVYYNFGSLVINIINNDIIECFEMHKLFNKIKLDDKKYTFQDIIYKTKFFNKFHTFEFYRNLFNKYMKYV
jgi:hypothetical protein